MKQPLTLASLFLGLFLILVQAPLHGQNHNSSLTAYVGATILDGSGADPISNGVLLVGNGKVVAIGSSNGLTVPSDATIVDVKGKTIIPGLINAHGHVGVANGLETSYSKENVVRDLNTNARYGITTVVSLGDGQQASVDLRNAQNVPTLNRSRLFVACHIVSGATPEAAKKIVDEDDAYKVDFIKIRVDDNLGTSPKMSPNIYKTVIDYAHSLGYPVASHIFYQDDAKALVRAGSNYIAHSVRDQVVDDELVGLLKENHVAYCPTLMREVSTYIFGSEPDYFSDPFFTKEVPAEVIAQLRDPERMKSIAQSKSAQAYKVALDTAMVNLKKLSDAGVSIVMGTDSGVAGRFPGYFEHLELELMVQSGMTPMQALVSATGGAATALNLKDVGLLWPGKWADFVVLDQNPLQNIANTRSIKAVFIAGNQVPAKTAP